METNNQAEQVNEKPEEHVEQHVGKVKNPKRVEAGKKGAAARWAKRNKLLEENMEENTKEKGSKTTDTTAVEPTIVQITKDNPVAEKHSIPQTHSKYFIPVGLTILGIAGLYVFMKTHVKKIQPEAPKPQTISKEVDPFDF